MRRFTSAIPRRLALSSGEGTILPDAMTVEICNLVKSLSSIPPEVLDFDAASPLSEGDRRKAARQSIRGLDALSTCSL
jgi:hypothetical protein